MDEKYLSHKGIILAGGSGTRLYPITFSSNKQLLPIYDKPMIFYSLSTLMLAKIKDVLIITNKEYLDFYIRLLGDGSFLGMNIRYEIQNAPNGIAEAFLIGRDFIGTSKVSLILGDNIFYGSNFEAKLTEAKNHAGASIFAYRVSDPERYGVVEFNDSRKAISLEEKPRSPRSSYAVTGLYFYDNKVLDIASTLRPSKRGELEITDVNNIYLSMGELNVHTLSRGFAWLDTGTFDSMLDASSFVRSIEKRQGIKIACLEEIAYRNQWINSSQLESRISILKNNEYADYLKTILHSHVL